MLDVRENRRFFTISLIVARRNAIIMRKRTFFSKNLTDQERYPSHAPLKLLIIAVICLQPALSGCSKKKEDDMKAKEPARIAAREMEALIKKTGISLDQLKKASLALNEAEIDCNQSHIKNKKKASACLAEKQKKILQKNKIPSAELGKIRKAHAFLRWELSNFMKKHNMKEAEIKKIYSDAMVALRNCEDSVKKKGGPRQTRRTEECANSKLKKMCDERNITFRECGKIISMGVDYSWPSPGIRSETAVNPKYSK